MNNGIAADFNEMEEKLKTYVDKGRLPGASRTTAEPTVMLKPDPSMIKPLSKTRDRQSRFVAVDCSTRTLKRANNWGIYLMRAAYATVKERDVDWDYCERIWTVVGDARVRRSFLQDFRMELESQIALHLLKQLKTPSHYVHDTLNSTYFLLDGGGYFGGERKFRVALYEECEKEKIKLLAISKNSPSLHDDKGRDLLATTYMMTDLDVWVCHPIRVADKDKSLYGDIAIVKLCKDSPHIFRCDIMDYLTKQSVSELLSPLTSTSEDPRCVGYPIPLWLAHDFSAPSDSMLLTYHDKIEEALGNAGLLKVLHREELSCRFADELHGVRRAFEWEWWDEQF